jgi:hypothetical protein
MKKGYGGMSIEKNSDFSIGEKGNVHPFVTVLSGRQQNLHGRERGMKRAGDDMSHEYPENRRIRRIDPA